MDSVTETKEAEETNAQKRIDVGAWVLRTPLVLPLLAFATILILWEVGTRLFNVPPYILPAPTRILSGYGAIDAGRWVEHVWATLRVALIGYAVAIAVSLPIAVGLAKSRFMSRAIYPLLVVIQSVPVVAVAPIIIVVLGTDEHHVSSSPS